MQGGAEPVRAAGLRLLQCLPVLQSPHKKRPLQNPILLVLEQIKQSRTRVTNGRIVERLCETLGRLAQTAYNRGHRFS